MATVQNVHDLVRALVGERQVPPEVFTDAFLLGLTPSVYREIQQRFADAGNQLLITTVGLNIPAGTVVANPATPGWPANGVIKPIRLWERIQTAVLFQDWVLMEEADPELVIRPATLTLSHWEWRSGSLNFVGALQNNSIRMQYNGYLADLVALTDLLTFDAWLDAMAFGTAAAAVHSRGGTERAKDFDGAFTTEVESLINTDKSRNEGA